MTYRRQWLFHAVLAACLVLLPALAILQYRWVGQVSDAERERMRRNLTAAAERMGAAFDSEITRLHGQVSLGRPVPEADSLVVYADRFTEWTAQARYPELVRSFYVANSQPGESELWKLDRASGRFRKTEWPERLISLREQLAVRSRGEVPPGPPWNLSSLDGCPVLVAPEAVVQFIPRAPMLGIARRIPIPRVWSILELDCDQIREKILPAYLAAFLAHEGRLEYRVQVVSRVPAAKVVFDSGTPPSTTPIDAPDARAALFALRPEQVLRREAMQFNVRMFFSAPVHLPHESPWTLLLKHEAGSLEAAVQRTRVRNLGVSAAILLLLGSSVLALAVSTRRAQLLAQAQVEFVAGVSHELRTPLAVIRSAGENLADGLTLSEQKIRQYGELVRDEGRRLSSMVEQILAFARTEAGHAGAVRQPSAIAEILDRAVDGLRGEPGANTAEIRRELEPGLPPLKCDAAALAHCFRNLLLNAIRHGGGDSPVEVFARRAGTSVEIEVRDHGPGVDTEDARSIFEPFYRGRTARENQVRGLGLGLTLVRRIVEVHGGSIRLESPAGAGAAFIVRLPREA